MSFTTASILRLAIAILAFATASAVRAEDWHAEFARRTAEAYTAVTPMPLLSAAHPDATLADG